MTRLDSSSPEARKPDSNGGDSKFLLLEIPVLPGAMDGGASELDSGMFTGSDCGAASSTTLSTASLGGGESPAFLRKSISKYFSSFRERTRLRSGSSAPAPASLGGEPASGSGGGGDGDEDTCGEKDESSVGGSKSKSNDATKTEEQEEVDLLISEEPFTEKLFFASPKRRHGPRPHTFGQVSIRTLATW